MWNSSQMMIHDIIVSPVVDPKYSVYKPHSLCMILMSCGMQMSSESMTQWCYSWAFNHCMLVWKMNDLGEKGNVQCIWHNAKNALTCWSSDYCWRGTAEAGVQGWDSKQPWLAQNRTRTMSHLYTHPGHCSQEWYQDIQNQVCYQIISLKSYAIKILSTRDMNV